MSREEARNYYGYTKQEAMQAIEDSRLRQLRAEALERQKEREKFDNFFNAMCGTGLIKKVY